MFRWLALSAAIFLCGILALAHAQETIIGGGVYGAGKASSGGCSATFALDGAGTANNSSANSFTIPVTTSNGCGVVVLGLAVLDSQTLNSVSAPGLSFSLRTAYITGGGSNCFEYTAPYSTNFSGNVTINMSASGYSSGIAFGISGAPSSSYFDSNVALPGTTITAGTAAAGATSNANDFIFSFYSMSNNNGISPGSGWSQISNETNYYFAQYQIVSSTQTLITGNTNANSEINCGYLDAIIK